MCFYSAKIIQFTDIKNDLKAFNALKITGFWMSDFLCIFAVRKEKMWRDLAACNHTKKC